MSKIKNGGLNQYDAEPFEQQQFGTASVEGVNNSASTFNNITHSSSILLLYQNSINRIINTTESINTNIDDWPNSIYGLNMIRQCVVS